MKNDSKTMPKDNTKAVPETDAETFVKITAKTIAKTATAKCMISGNWMTLSCRQN